MRGPLVGRRLRSSVFGAHSIHSLLHSVSWCKDPANCSSALRPPANQGTAPLRWQCHQRTARACDHPPFILSPSIPKPPPASTSRVLRGRPTRGRAASRGALSQLAYVETLVKTERSHATTERGTHSERWPSFLAVTVFSIFAEPALPVLRCQETAIFADPSFKLQMPWNVGNSTEEYHSHLAR